MKFTFNKLGVALTTGILTLGLCLGSVGIANAAPTTNDSNTSTAISMTESVSQVNENPTYQRLSSLKKQQFSEILQGMKLTTTQQLALLEQYAQEHPQPPYGEAKWKTSVIKKIAKLIAAKVGAKSVSSIMDFLTGWEGQLQDGIQYYLEKYCHFNSTVAYWTAKTIVFLAF